MSTDGDTSRRLLLMNFKAAVRTVLRFEGLPINVGTTSRSVDHLTTCIHRIFSHRLRKPATKGYDKLVMAVAEHSAGIRGTVARATAADPNSHRSMSGEGGAKRWIHETLAAQEMGPSLAALTADPYRIDEFYHPDALMATPTDIDQFELCASALDGDRPVPSSRSSLKSPWPPPDDLVPGEQPLDRLQMDQNAATERDLLDVAAALSQNRAAVGGAGVVSEGAAGPDPRRVSPALDPEWDGTPSPQRFSENESAQSAEATVISSPVKDAADPRATPSAVDALGAASQSLPHSPSAAVRRRLERHKRTPSDGVTMMQGSPMGKHQRSQTHSRLRSPRRPLSTEPVIVPLALPQLSRDLVTSSELDSENAHFAVSEQLIAAMEEATNADLTPGGDLFWGSLETPPETLWPSDAWQTWRASSVSTPHGGGGSAIGGPNSDSVSVKSAGPLIPPENLMDMYRRSWGDAATHPSGKEECDDDHPGGDLAPDTPPNAVFEDASAVDSHANTINGVALDVSVSPTSVRPANAEDQTDTDDDSDDDLEELMARRHELAKEVGVEGSPTLSVDVDASVEVKVDGRQIMPSFPNHLQQSDGGNSSVGSFTSLSSEYDPLAVDYIRLRRRIQLSRPTVLSNYGGDSKAERTALGFLQSLPTGAPEGDVPPELQLMVGDDEVPQGLLPQTGAEVSFQEMGEGEGGWVDVDYTKGSDSAGEDNRSRSENQSMLRGTEDWAPPRRQIIFHQQPKLSRKEALTRQNNRCAGCGLRVARTYLNAFRYCDYLAKYFCTSCHNKQLEMIPARILGRWDFRKQYVSKFAAELLQSISSDPLFSVRDVNATLYRKVRSLQAARDLRLQLGSIHRYLLSCAKKPKILTEVTNLKHLIDDPDLYSISELYQVYEGTMVPYLQTLIDRCVAHIRTCMLCTNRGYYCDICHEDEIIFPFERTIIEQCTKCNACFHKRCWARKKGDCPKCVRIAMYRNRREEATI